MSFPEAVTWSAFFLADLADRALDAELLAFAMVVVSYTLRRAIRGSLPIRRPTNQSGKSCKNKLLLSGHTLMFSIGPST